jgi:hypothetical protein
VAAAVAGLVLVLEDEHLAIAAALEDFGNDASALDERVTDLGRAVPADEEDFRELDGRARLGGKQVNVQRLVRADSVLAAARANDGVDGKSSV